MHTKIFSELNADLSKLYSMDFGNTANVICNLFCYIVLYIFALLCYYHSCYKDYLSVTQCSVCFIFFRVQG